MPYDLTSPLVIGISSRTLFNPESRIKECCRKRRPSSHNCPQCGQFEGGRK